MKNDDDKRLSRSAWMVLAIRLKRGRLKADAAGRDRRNKPKQQRRGRGLSGMAAHSVAKVYEPTVSETPARIESAPLLLLILTNGDKQQRRKPGDRGSCSFDPSALPWCLQLPGLLLF